VLFPPTPSEVVFDLGRGRLTVLLDTPGMSFKYTEPKDLTVKSSGFEEVSPALRELSFLMVAFPLRLFPDAPLKSASDVLFFGEIPLTKDTEMLLR
jgi:hypothetical protein